MRACLCQIAIVCALVAGAAWAVPVTWDADLGTGGLQDGGGTWNTTAANWWTGSGYKTWSNAPADSATFGVGGPASGAVTLAEPITTAGITFNAPANYTLGGNTLTLSGSPIIAANVDAAINSILAGTGFTKTGAGTLTLGGANTYAGPTIISEGTLKMGGAAPTPVQAYSISQTANQNHVGSLGYDFQVNAGKTVTITQLGSYDSGGDGLGTSHTVRIYSLGGGTIYAEATIPAGLVAPLSAGYRFVPLASPVSLGPGSYSIALLNSGGPDQNYNSWGAAMAGPVNGGLNGELTFIGSSRWGSTNAYPGNNDGGPAYRYGAASMMFQSSAAGSLPAATALEIAAGAAFDLNASSQSVASLADGGGGGGAVINSAAVGGAVLSLGAAAGVTTFSGTISDGGPANAVSLVKSGGAAQVLAGNNSHSGSTTISGGVLQIGNGGASGSLGSGPVLNNASLVFNRSNTLSVPNAISGTGSLTQAGSGTTILTGANSYAGTTTISSGVLQVGNGGTTGTLGTGPVVGNASLVFNRSDALAVPNVISGTGSLTMAGSGTLTLNGANTYNGPTLISQGTLRLGTGSLIQAYSTSFNQNQNHTGSLGYDFRVNPGKSIAITQLGAYDSDANGLLTGHTVNIYSVGGGTLYATGAIPAGTAAPYTNGYRFVSLVSPVTLGPGDYSLCLMNIGGGFDQNYNAGSGLAGTLNSGLAGEVTFIGRSRWSGTVGAYPANLDASIYQYGAASMVFKGMDVGSLPATSPVQIASSGTLDLNGLSQTLASLADGGGGGGALVNGNPTAPLTLTLKPTAGSTTFGGSISDAGAANAISLVKNGPGTQILSGVNTYSGPTTVNQGALIINGSISSPVTVTGGWLGGSGTIGGNVNIQAAGGVSAGTSPGHLLILGGYTQSGTLLAELGGTGQGTQYDWIEVAGAATLGGTIDMDFVNSFTAAPGMYFDILTAAGGITNTDLSGVTFDFSDAGFGWPWVPEIVALGGGAEALRLNASPEPASLMLLALGGLALLRRRRTR